VGSILVRRGVLAWAGRAIRHRDDYAAIVLVDRRYAQAHIRAKLPAWIGDGLDVPQAFGQLYATVQKVYMRIGCP
jgi:chromosome transmission fidelity protein 1